MDSADDGNVESYGMMGFALRRLERFCGIERSQTDAIWTSPSAYAETVFSRDDCNSRFHSSFFIEWIVNNRCLLVFL